MWVQGVPWWFRFLLLGVVVLVVLNIFYPLPAWNMERERNIATYFHSAILLATAVTFWAVFASGARWRRSARAPVPQAPLWLLGGFAFLYLSLDEATEIHERVFAKTFQALGLWDKVLHYRLTPALWEVLFAPLFIAIGLLLLAVLWRNRQQVEAAFWLGLGAMALWGVALALEFVQLMYLRHSKPWFTVAVRTEEIAEVLGSTAFLLAAVLIARHLREGSAAAIREEERAWRSLPSSSPG